MDRLLVRSTSNETVNMNPFASKKRRSLLTNRRKGARTAEPKVDWPTLVCFVLVAITLMNVWPSLPSFEEIFGGPNYGYRSRKELLGRAQRFPPVEERVKVYMSNWYTPPCGDSVGAIAKFNIKSSDNTEDLPSLLVREVSVEGAADRKTVLLDGEVLVQGNQPFFMDPDAIWNCNKDVCRDVSTFLFPALEDITKDTTDFVPTLLHFGDAEMTSAMDPSRANAIDYPQIPLIRKFRHALPKDDILKMTSLSCVRGRREIPANAYGVHRLQPVIWKLATKTHFGMLSEIPRVDSRWRKKMDAAVFRGTLNGIREISDSEYYGLSDRDKCLSMPRCRLVLNSVNSHSIDASLVGSDKTLPRVIDGVQVFGESMSYGEMLRYKAIVVMEGNEISAGLKWALFSRSVVLTPKPTLTSWAMEELLEPWVHYIPLKNDLSDVEERVQWIQENDREAEKIARRGFLWMQDLMFHPDAPDDDTLIYEEMLLRYRKHFEMDPHVA